MGSGVTGRGEATGGIIGAVLMGARVGGEVTANGACEVTSPMHDDATARGKVIFLMKVFGNFKETKRMCFEQGLRPKSDHTE